MERQFWQTAELLWRRIYEAPGPGYRERCMELFSMTRSSFCLQKEWREDNFTRTETLLLNNAGLGFLWEKRYREAAGVFLQLYSINERTGKKRSDYRKKKAVLWAIWQSVSERWGGCRTPSAIMSAEPAASGNRAASLL